MNLIDGHKIKQENDDTLFGTMVYDYDKKAVAIVIKTWDNGFHSNEGFLYYTFATCVDKKGKRYETPFVNLTAIENLSDKELEELGLKK